MAYTLRFGGMVAPAAPWWVHFVGLFATFVGGLLEDHGRVGPAWASAAVDLGEAPEFNFLVLGDFGCGIDDDTHNLPCPHSHEGGRCCHAGNVGQLAVAKAMTDDAYHSPVDFIINAGDAFYWYGVENSSDPRFNKTFTEVYNSQFLQKPWYGVLGNHDWKKNASALVTEYLNWKIPALSYTANGFVGGVPLTIFFLDTNYVERLDVCNDRNRSMWGGRHLTEAEYGECFEELKEIFDQQLVWFEESLEKASRKIGHKIVVAHEPVYGAGKYHFTSDQSETEKLLEHKIAPLLKKYGVKTYINAHDHLLQHLSWDGTDYYIVGAGGAYLDDEPKFCAEDDNHLRYTSLGKLYGYSRASVNSSHVCMTFKTVDKGQTEETYSHCRQLIPDEEPGDDPGASDWPLKIFILLLILLLLCGVFIPGLAVLCLKKMKQRKQEESGPLGKGRSAV